MKKNMYLSFIPNSKHLCNIKLLLMQKVLSRGKINLPLLILFFLLQSQLSIAQVLPVSIDFNTDDGSLVMVQDAQTNYWMHGYLDAHGSNCMYITNNGIDNTYTITASSVSHLYTPINFNGITTATLSFDWMAEAESGWDYLRVYLVPDSYVISAGTQISGSYLLGTFNGVSSVQTETISLSSDEILADNMKLVFSWRNDGSVGTMPPASVDNISLIEREASSEKEIISASCVYQTNNAIINSTDYTLEIETYGQDITNISPSFALSQYASISPASGIAQDFTNPVIYTVTAEDGTVQEWTVTVTNIIPNYQSLPLNTTFETDIESFVFIHANQENYWMHGYLEAYEGNCMFITNNGTNNDYVSTSSVSHLFVPINFNGVQYANLSFDWMAYGGSSYYDNLKVFLVPDNIEIQAGVQISNNYLLGSYSRQNSINNASINLGIEDLSQDQMKLVFSWSNSVYYSAPPASIKNISLTERTPSSNNEILSASCSGQTQNASINATDFTVDIETYNQDINNLSPGFTLPQYASISPASGEAQDFTNPVTYTVTAEDGTIQEWTVTITNITPNYQPLPFSASFETDYEGFILMQANQENYWMYGYLDAYEGNCMYITNNGADNVYSSTYSVSHLFVPVNFNGVQYANLSFDWMSYGGYTYNDNLKVFLVPDDIEIQAGSEISNDYLLGFYSRQNSVNNASINIGVDAISQDQMKLVFSWRNSYFDSTIPASIKNISLTERTPSSEKEILSVSCSGQTQNAGINSTDFTIDIEAYDQDITNISPSINISQYASISPASGEGQDFTNPVTYTVTAEDATIQEWIVTVSNITPNYQPLPFNATFETENEGFILMQANQENYWMYGYLDAYEGNCMYITNNGVDNDYSSTSSVSHLFVPINFDGVQYANLSFDWMAYGGYSYYDNLKVFLVPDNIEIQSGTQVSDDYLLGSYSRQNSVNNATINLGIEYISQDQMKLVFSWSNSFYNSAPPASVKNISLTERTPSSEKEILSVSCNGQTQNASINSTDFTIEIETYDQDNTNISPTINISQYASISPASDIAQDFTNPVTYAVTAEDGTIQEWIVTVSNITPNYQPLPFNAIFETENEGFILMQANQENYWMYGYLDAYEGNCMYITNNGIDNDYSSTSSVSHLFVPINFDGVQYANLSFDWMAYGGYSVYDNLNVFLVPDNIEIQAGAQVSDDYLLGSYSRQNSVNNASINLGIDDISQDQMKLVFSWSNYFYNSAPPASVKNISLTERTPSSENEILSVSCSGQTQNASINSTDFTIEIETYDQDISNLSPSFNLSQYASISPAPEVGQDFTNPVTYTVTAEDGTYQEWTVSITNITTDYQPLPINATFETDSEGFIIIQANQENYWMHGYLEDYSSNCMYITNNNADNTYTIDQSATSHLFKEVNFNGNQYASLSFDWMTDAESCCDYLSVYLVPETITIEAGSQISNTYLLGRYNNVSSVQTVEIHLSTEDITEDNMKLVFSWHNDGSVGSMPAASIDNISLTERTPSSEKDIISISCIGQTQNAIINSAAYTLEIETYGQDITNLSPVFSISQHASISPASEVAQDFTNPVTYTVTAEDGTVQEWNVTVTNITPYYQLLPINATFETDDEGFVFMHANQENYWMHGYLEAYEGNCMYITNNGTDNDYSSTPSVSHLFVPINFDGVQYANLSFDWMAYGGSSYNENLKVFLVPDNIDIQSGVRVSNDYLLGSYSRQNSVNNVSMDLSIDAISQNQMKLVFSWSNSVYYNAPPASIKNISLMERVPSSENDILTFSCSGQTQNAIINSTDHTIEVVTYNQDITNLNPGFTLSQYASVSPASDETQDFTNPVDFTVTAEDGTDQVWTVTISNITPEYQLFPINATFENDEEGFIFLQANEENYWIHGYLEAHESNCMYISNNNMDNTYTIDQSATSHLFKQINFNGNRLAVLSFDWLADAEYCCDYLNVYLVPEAITFDSGSEISEDYLLGKYNSASSVQKVKIDLDSEDITEDNMKLVFSWHNDGSIGRMPAASIDNVVIREYADENAILDFVIAEQTAPAVIDDVNYTVEIEVVNGTEITNLTPVITISDFATINPDSEIAQDFTSSVTYTVTAENGDTQDWVVSVTEALSSENAILDFVLADQTAAAVIDDVNYTVEIEVANGTDITNLTPVITVSDFATINPDSETTQDFTSSVTYTVTAENGDTQDWVVSVTETLSSENAILDFVLADQTAAAVIDDVNYTIEIEVANGTDITNLTPVITVSDFATINPDSETTQDFTSSVTYTVTAENGDTQDWVVSVTETLSSENAILDFVLAEQTAPAVIDDVNYTVEIEVANGTDITNLTPVITVSDFATINPHSETTQNFTSSVTYTVTAENGDTQDWVVYVSVATNIDSNLSVSLNTYPNPFKESFNVSLELPMPEDVTIELIDLAGKQTWYKEYTNTSSIFEKVIITSSSKGIYLLKITYNEKVITQKILRK